MRAAYALVAATVRMLRLVLALQRRRVLVRFHGTLVDRRLALVTLGARLSTRVLGLLPGLRGALACVLGSLFGRLAALASALP